MLSLLADRVLPLGDRLAVLAHHKNLDQSRVAVIKVDAIGDFFVWLDAAGHLREIFPSKRIILVCNSTWADVAMKLPFWDDVFKIDQHRFLRRPLYRWRTIRKLSHLECGVTLQASYSRDYLYCDSIARACHSLMTVGHHGNLSNITLANKLRSDLWYSDLLEPIPDRQSELERNNFLINALSTLKIQPNIPTIRRIASRPPDLEEKQPYFIVFPGAGKPYRRWPSKNFAFVINALARHTGWRAVLCGGEADRDVCSDIHSRVLTPCLDRSGKTGLIDLIEYIRAAKLVISNETSAIHIATATGTPAVCILGGGHFGRFLPYPANVADDKQVPVSVFSKMECFGCNWKCIYSRKDDEVMPCISVVSSSEVLSACFQALKNVDTR